MEAQPVKKQLRGAQHGPRKFFDRKVGHYGYSPTLALGQAIPWEWRYVRIYVIEQSDKHAVIRVEKLLGGYPDTRHQKNRQRHKQDP